VLGNALLLVIKLVRVKPNAAQYLSIMPDMRKEILKLKYVKILPKKTQTRGQGRTLKRAVVEEETEESLDF